MIQPEKKQMIILAAMLYFCYFIIMNKWGLQGDMEFWMDWSQVIFNHGLVSIYDEDTCNYLPGYLYIIWLYTKIQHTLTNVRDNLNILKMMVLVFDFAGAWLVVSLIKDRGKKLFAFLFMIANAAYVYNTIAWGQVDAIFSFFGFAAVLAALHRKMIWSCVLLVVALNFKLQALVFIPVTGLLLLPQFTERFSIALTVKLLSAVIITQVIMIFPFLLGGQAHKIWEILTGYVGSYPYISVGALNTWSLFIPGDIEHHIRYSDSGIFLGLTYKTWGLLMFVVVVVASVYPLVRFLYQRYVQKSGIEFPLEKVFLITALIGAGFYYFNTQMHERYFHPALLPLAAYTFLSGNYFPFIVGSAAYFLNMEKILQSIALTNYNIFIFHPVFVASLYAVLIIYLFYRLYEKHPGNTENIELTVTTSG